MDATWTDFTGNVAFVLFVGALAWTIMKWNERNWWL